MRKGLYLFAISAFALSLLSSISFADTLPEQNFKQQSFLAGQGPGDGSGNQGNGPKDGTGKGKKSGKCANA